MPLLQPIQLLGCILTSRAYFISRLHYSPVPISFAPLAALKMGAGAEDALFLLLFFLISNRRARFVQGTPCLLCSLPTFFAHTSRFASKNLKNARTDLHSDFTLQKTPAKLSVRLFLRCHH